MNNSNNTAFVQFETSSIISAPHGFSTRIGGVSSNEYASLNLGMNRGDDPKLVSENWKRFLDATRIGYRPFVCGKQIHENNVHVAIATDARYAYGEGELIEADGYVTGESNLPLAIFTADCVPVLLEDEVSGVVGAIHCGWRSAVSDIEAETVKKMLLLGSTPSDIKVAIGPAINKCCFEVGPEVIDAVNDLIGAESSEKYYSDKPNGKYMLDLKGVVACRFLQLGIKTSNIDFVGGCTMCNPDRYYSHRYSNGSRGSLASVIMKR